MTSIQGLKRFWKKEHTLTAQEEGQSRSESGTATQKDREASSKEGAHHDRHSLSAHRGHAKEDKIKKAAPRADEEQSHGKDDDKDDDDENPTSSDHKVTRKRSILLNLMLPPEPAPVDSQLSLPPIDMYNPNPTAVVVPSAPSSSSRSREPKKAVGPATSSWTATKTTTRTTEETESRTIHMPWSWSWFGHGAKEKGATSKQDKEQRRVKNGGKDTSESLIRSLTVTETKTETMSRTVQAKAWISKLGQSADDSSDVRQRRRPNGMDGAAGGGQDSELSEGMPGGAVEVGQREMVGELPQELQHPQQQQSQTLQQEIIHQEIHNKTRTVSLVSVNVSDIFGLGKCLEVILAMMKAHEQFLSRQPFWLQCVIMSWEGLMMFLILWGLLRIVGLAEIVVWGADDLVRGTLSTVRRVGHVVQFYLAYY